MKETTPRAWTQPSRSLSTFPSKHKTPSGHWSTIRAEHLQVVREPLRWNLDLGERAKALELECLIRRAAVGPCEESWRTPEWLLPHQVDAARRIKKSIDIFRGALLADAVGLGKTYVALAVASRYARTCAAVPAALVSQWRRVSMRVGVAINIVTHEALSRRAAIPSADLVIVDEAHRFRNPTTRRYERLARAVNDARTLLLSASPVVNRPSDLGHLLRLFICDNAFSLLGMPSIEEAISKRDHALLIRAAASAVVARSPETIDELIDELPRVRDDNIFRASSVDQRILSSLLRVIDGLELPTTAIPRECALLRLHLLHRLSSSRTAFSRTVRRHLVYTDRAIEATARGETLSRSLAQRIFSNEFELQLILGDLAEPSRGRELNSAALNADRRRLRKLLSLLSTTNGFCPKSRRLEQILKLRAGRKTIVFTTAVATALELAHSLQWREIAVVGGGHSRIASGRIPVDEALSLFAPRARGRREPPLSMRVSTLIATDFASEGLDLQDADAIVHYDLPWTPLKLEQRVGRIARLGSTFRTTDVYWFAPPKELDHRLRMESRISEKVNAQIGLHVPATSKLGRVRIVNRELQRREQIGRSVCDRGGDGSGFAVARGPRCAVVAIRWHTGDAGLPDLIALGGDPLREYSSFAMVEETINGLLSAKDSPEPPPEELVGLLLQIIRKRLASADRGAMTQSSRRLARGLLKRAYGAGKRREARLLATLDGVLDRLRLGLSIGGERTLTRLLSGNPSREELSNWLYEQPTVKGGFPTFEIIAALFGDGSSASL